jgi:uncharacterized membrane protein
LASGRGTRPSLALTLVGAGLALAVAYPLAAERAVAAFGARAVSAALLALAAAGVFLSRRRAVPGFGLPLRALAVALPALALFAGDARYLALFPAAIQAALCGLFLGSLAGGGSILEQAAKTLEPYAPDFIRPYCRKATAAFAALFALQAAALAVLAFAAPGPGWAWRAILWVWAPTLAFTAVEFAVRKAWFRHYGEGPLDRLLRRLLPPENTAQGRRSLDWIRAKRKELGLPPPQAAREKP